jgi:hypothetical protein
LVRNGTFALGLVALLGPLTGCSTTQQQNVRLRLRADRILASQVGMRVHHQNPQVTVLGVSTIDGSGVAAVAVTLRNDTNAPLSNLPISVGLHTATRTIYLNRAAGIDYFQTHVAAIAAGATLTWVFANPTSPLPAGTAFATVGRPGLVADEGTLTRVPTLAAKVLSVTGASASVSVTNTTSFPQYDLTIYASAGTAAAGSASIAELDAGQSTKLNVPLAGSTTAGQLVLAVPPTITE